MARNTTVTFFFTAVFPGVRFSLSRIRWRIAACAVAATTLALASCGGEPWEQIEVSNETLRADVLAIDLYAPLDREALLRDAERAYGSPKSAGSESQGTDYVWFKEYVSRVGRVRVYEEHYQTDDGMAGSQWLETYPGALYVEDLLRSAYASRLPHHSGAWKATFMPKDRSWYVTVAFDGRAVTKVSDLPGR